MNQDELIEGYRREIAEKDALITDLQERLANSVPKNPNNFEGWTVVRSADGYVRLFKKFHGKNVGTFIGKTFDADVARRKIAEMTARLKPGVTLMPKKRGRKEKTQEKRSET